MGSLREGKCERLRRGASSRARLGEGQRPL